MKHKEIFLLFIVQQFWTIKTTILPDWPCSVGNTDERFIQEIRLVYNLSDLLSSPLSQHDFFSHQYNPTADRFHSMYAYRNITDAFSDLNGATPTFSPQRVRKPFAYRECVSNSTVHLLLKFNGDDFHNYSGRAKRRNIFELSGDYCVMLAFALEHVILRVKLAILDRPAAAKILQLQPLPAMLTASESPNELENKLQGLSQGDLEKENAKDTIILQCVQPLRTIDASKSPMDYSVGAAIQLGLATQCEWFIEAKPLSVEYKTFGSGSSAGATAAATAAATTAALKARAGGDSAMLARALALVFDNQLRVTADTKRQLPPGRIQCRCIFRAFATSDCPPSPPPSYFTSATAAPIATNSSVFRSGWGALSSPFYIKSVRVFNPLEYETATAGVSKPKTVKYTSTIKAILNYDDEDQNEVLKRRSRNQIRTPTEQQKLSNGDRQPHTSGAQMQMQMKSSCFVITLLCLLILDKL